jgi:hypothetical protein
MKQRMALRRCCQLGLADLPPAEVGSEAYKAVAARFASDMSRFRDEWTTFDYSSTPLVWREGRIAIRYRFLSPDGIVEVLSVGLEDDPRSEPSHPPDPMLARPTYPEARKTHQPQPPVEP